LGEFQAVTEHGRSGCWGVSHVCMFHVKHPTG
jgi:hypothetical protein